MAEARKTGNRHFDVANFFQLASLFLRPRGYSVLTRIAERRVQCLGPCSTREEHILCRVICRTVSKPKCVCDQGGSGDERRNKEVGGRLHGVRYERVLPLSNCVRMNWPTEIG